METFFKGEVAVMLGHRFTAIDTDGSSREGTITIDMNDGHIYVSSTPSCSDNLLDELADRFREITIDFMDKLTKSKLGASIN